MSRRANGEGSVYRRADGRWAGAFYVLRPDGGRQRRTAYGKTRKEVSAKLTEMAAKTAAGVPLAVKSWTVASYADYWIASVVEARCRPSTVSSYRGTLRKHIVPAVGSVTLRRLTPAHVRTLMAAKLEAGGSVRSVQIMHAVLRAMLAEAVREELVERNVASIVKGPAAKHEEVKPWGAVEASAVLGGGSR